MMESGIYSIRNIENDKVYIGSAASIKKRWQSHKLQLGKNCHDNGRLQNAWNKYGAERFVFQIIEQIEDISMLIKREQYWMDKLNVADRSLGYNLRPTAGSQLGFRHSSESKKKNSIANRGKKLSPEHKEKIRIASTGRAHSPEARKKISEFHTGLKLTQATKDKLRVARLLQGQPPIAVRTPEYRAKLSAALKGRKLPKETCIKMSLARTGIPRSAETKAAMSRALMGRTYSEETRAKMALSASKREYTPELRAAMAAGQRRRQERMRAAL